MIPEIVQYECLEFIVGKFALRLSAQFYAVSPDPDVVKRVNESMDKTFQAQCQSCCMTIASKSKLASQPAQINAKLGVTVSWATHGGVEEAFGSQLLHPTEPTSSQFNCCPHRLSEVEVGSMPEWLDRVLK